MILAAAEADRSSFVDLDVPVWAWVLLLVLIVVLLAIDLYRHRDAHAPSQKEALFESMVWVMCGLGFSAFIAITFGYDAFGEYISGYLIEKSLSIDNVFVWSMLFATLSIPLKYQHRVLFWGIFGALTLRAIFILLGTALLSRFWWLLLVFGAFLVYTGFKIIRHRADEGTKEATRGLGLLSKIMPVTEQLDGQKFYTATGPSVTHAFSPSIRYRRSSPSRTSRTSFSPRMLLRSWGCVPCTSCWPTPRNASTSSRTPSVAF